MKLDVVSGTVSSINVVSGVVSSTKVVSDEGYFTNSLDPKSQK